MHIFEVNKKDRVGPLEGSDGNIITEGFLMTENLNVPVFTREYIAHCQYQRISSKGESQSI